MNKDPVLIKLLKAGNGDSILISFFDENRKRRTILVDGGNNFNEYKKHLLEEVKFLIRRKSLLDLIVITHIDQDHIKGITYLIKEFSRLNSDIPATTANKYWFNSAKKAKAGKRTTNFDISISEMEALELFLHQQPDDVWNIADKIIAPYEFSFFNSKLTILSPNQAILAKFNQVYSNDDIASESSDYNFDLKTLIAKEKQRVIENNEDLDHKLENATSIAFLWERKQKSVLFTGDAVPHVIDQAIKDLITKRGIQRLVVDVVKLSHHASRRSISNDFLSLIDCSKFLISTNGKKARLPNKSTIAKIISHPNRSNREIDFYFNYPGFSTILNISREEKIKFRFTLNDGNYKHGQLLSI